MQEETSLSMTFKIRSEELRLKITLGITRLAALAASQKYSGCMCTFVNQIKTIKLFKYEKMQVNIVYLN